MLSLLAYFRLGIKYKVQLFFLFFFQIYLIDTTVRVYVNIQFTWES